MISIEETIFKSLLHNDTYARKVMPYIDNECFDGIHKILFNTYKSLFDKYNKIPTFEALAITIQKQPISESDFSELAEFVGELYKDKNDLPDTEWLVNETEEFCRDKKIYNAIYQSINVIEGTDSKLDKFAIPGLLEDALNVSFDSSIGMELFDDAERRYELYTAEDYRIKFPLECLNLLSNGGLRKKSLSAFLASTNVGKTGLMVFLAGEFLKMGLNILYITLEMAEDQISERVEANLLDVTTDNLKKLSKDEYLGKLNKIKKKTAGKLFVKEYPTSSANASHFRQLIKELKAKKKFKPDVIFIDYLNICNSSRYKSMSGVNSYSYIKAIAEELRGLACECDLPIVTATQTNREGSNNNDVDMTSTSECLSLDTEVITKQGIKQIKNVNVGDKLLGSNGFVTVSMVHHPKRKKVYQIKTKSGKTIVCSGDHVFPTEQGRKSIKTGLIIGDKLKTLTDV